MGVRPKISLVLGVVFPDLPGVYGEEPLTSLWRLRVGPFSFWKATNDDYIHITEVENIEYVILPETNDLEYYEHR